MKKISICFYLILIIGLCGCLSSNIYNTSDEVSNGSSINTPTNGIEETSVPTPTRKVSSGPIVEPTRTPLTINKPKITSTPAPSINDVEIFFDKEEIKLTSRDDVQTVYLCTRLNGYSGEIEPPKGNVYGTGDVDLETGEVEIDSDLDGWKIPLTFSAIENGTLYIEYCFGENRKALLEIVVDVPFSENILHEDEYVKIFFSKVGKTGVEFLVENKTDYVLTVQADAIAINGYSTNDILMSDDIAPKSKGKAVAKCEDFEEGMKVDKISGQLRVIDFSYELFEHSYNVKFIDVKIQ